MAKMKILCLNTVQVLFQDAFDKFSSNLAGGSSDLAKIVDSTESESNANSKADSIGSDPNPSGLSASQPTDCCQRASTSFDDPNNNCLNCSSEYQMKDNDQNCQNQLNNQLNNQSNQLNTQLVGQFRSQQSSQQSGQSNQQIGQQTNQTSQSVDRRSLSQLVLCNLMQNLVDTIKEQCVKQLPGQVKIEKKKRKRKRKRKKSKASEM